ncbi:MAG TPA: transposase [Usitatibacter sp.]|jgi:putative transposase|nr:transposase [Usitatibacter sp.]
MARLPRIDIPNVPQHLYARGNNHMDIFLDDQDRGVFLKYLQEAASTQECALHAYVLMTNHVHLLATSHRVGDLSRMMQSVGRRFSRYFNTRQARSGTLFEGRFGSSLVQSERYLLTCMRYIEENPVRAGLAAKPSEYLWSSHSQNATGSPGGLVTAHAIFEGIDSAPSARGVAYRALFRHALKPDEIASIRESIAKNRVLGEESYRRRLGAELGRPAGITPRGRPKQEIAA